MNLNFTRCMSPVKVRREMWTTFLTYNLIRTTIATAVSLHNKAPRQISFVSACQYILASWQEIASMRSVSRIKQYCLTLLRQIASCQVGLRPGRFKPRVVKRRRDQEARLQPNPCEFDDVEFRRCLTKQESIGGAPGWIHGHRATLSEDRKSILIERGNVCSGDNGKTWNENIDDWRLQLDDWSWTRPTDRNWPRWEVYRNDKKSLHLFEYQTELWTKQSPALLGTLQPADDETLEKQIGKKPDLNAFSFSFKPPVKHDEVLSKDDDEYGTHRIRINGIIVRYNEESYCVRLTIEGELSQSFLDALTMDLQEKLSRMENTPCDLIP